MVLLRRRRQPDRFTYDLGCFTYDTPGHRLGRNLQLAIPTADGSVSGLAYDVEGHRLGRFPATAAVIGPYSAPIPGIDRIFDEY